MQKTVEKITNFMSEIAEKFDVSDDTAMRILEAAAGGIEKVADFVEENADSYECEDNGVTYDVVYTAYSYVGSQKRITIPKDVLRHAEAINGKLESKKNDYGALTIIPDTINKRYTVLFGDHAAEYDNARVCYPNSRGQVQFSARSLFCEGNSIDVLLYKDGKIVID